MPLLMLSYLVLQSSYDDCANGIDTDDDEGDDDINDDDINDDDINDDDKVDGGISTVLVLVLINA